MHCRSFFDRCRAHRCCAHLMAFICCGARTSGRRPLPGEGEAPRVRWGLCRWAIRGARKPTLSPGSPPKDVDGSLRPPQHFARPSIQPWCCSKPTLKMRETASTNGKQHWFSRYACTAASRCNWSLRFGAASLICYPAKDSLLKCPRSPRAGDEDVVGGRSGHGAPSSRGDAVY